MSDLQAIRDLEAKATPPPWDVDDSDIEGVSHADAALIAALRNAAPALLDAADILRESVDVMLLGERLRDITPTPGALLNSSEELQRLDADLTEYANRLAAIEPRAKAWREGQP